MNYAARSVISPDSNLETNEIGIPLFVARELTFSERVTRFNSEELADLIIRGAKKSEGRSCTLLGNVCQDMRARISSPICISMKHPSQHSVENSETPSRRTSRKSGKILAPRRAKPPFLRAVQSAGKLQRPECEPGTRARTTWRAGRA